MMLSEICVLRKRDRNSNRDVWREERERERALGGIIAGAPPACSYIVHRAYCRIVSIALGAAACITFDTSHSF
jgi:hypothetical protein